MLHYQNIICTTYGAVWIFLHGRPLLVGTKHHLSVMVACGTRLCKQCDDVSVRAKINLHVFPLTPTNSDGSEQSLHEHEAELFYSSAVFFSVVIFVLLNDKSRCLNSAK